MNKDEVLIRLPYEGSLHRLLDAIYDIRNQTENGYILDRLDIIQDTLNRYRDQHL